MTKEEFKQHRQDLKLSRKELAIKLKCSIHSIKAYELGKRKPDVLRADAFSKIIIENKLIKGLDN